MTKRELAMTKDTLKEAIRIHHQHRLQTATGTTKDEPSRPISRPHSQPSSNQLRNKSAGNSRSARARPQPLAYVGGRSGPLVTGGPPTDMLNTANKGPKSRPSSRAGTLPHKSIGGRISGRVVGPSSGGWSFHDDSHGSRSEANGNNANNANNSSNKNNSSGSGTGDGSDSGSKATPLFWVPKGKNGYNNSIIAAHERAAFDSRNTMMTKLLDQYSQRHSPTTPVPRPPVATSSRNSTVSAVSAASETPSSTSVSSAHSSSVERYDTVEEMKRLPGPRMASSTGFKIISRRGRNSYIVAVGNRPPPPAAPPVS